jgi:hypothetical protein
MWLSPPPPAPRLQGQMAFGAAGLGNFGRWRKKQGGACTALDCELAGRSLHMAGHCLLQKQSPFGCGWPVVVWAAVISASGPEICTVAGGVLRPAGVKGVQECREMGEPKGFSFSEVARRPTQLPQPGGTRDCAAGRDRVCVDTTPHIRLVCGTRRMPLRAYRRGASRGDRQHTSHLTRSL